MKIMAIMVDVDGVLIVHPNSGGWADDLERDIGIEPSLLHRAFFARHWHDVVNGRAALRDRLAPVLESIAPNVSCDTLIDYWFAHDAHLNHPLLAELAAIRATGVQVHLATVQEHERARYLWNALDFRNRFDAMHYAADLGCSKPDPLFFRTIESRTRFQSGSMFFVDDRIENVEAAIACGWSAALWTGQVTLHSLMANLE
ncbi:MAG: haloacid dehalogenase [Sphingobium sp.]|nr:haloacid dehalogenase [Sphingobium sp.]